MKKSVVWSSVLMGILAISTLAHQNCSPDYRIKSLTDPNDSLGGPDGPVVCDPNSPAPTHPAHGVVAELYYFAQDGATHATGVKKFFSPPAVKSDARLFFNEINVPTQMFDVGFKTQDGKYLESQNQTKLVEYFALKYFGSLAAVKSEDLADYQFAILSDDGAILELKVDGVWKTIVNNDGTTATRMGCSLTTVKLRKDEPIDLRYYYFQGPRMRIANVLLWRKVSGSPTLDEQCGKTGSEYFFDSQTSRPKATYQGLIKRGWSVVPSANLFLPKGIGPNPCIVKN